MTLIANKENEPVLETVGEGVRDSIVAAAQRLLAHYGYQKMTMNDLAREAGIGVGTIYLHFEGKADVAFAVMVRVHREVQVRLATIASSTLPIEERLHQIIMARVLLPYQGARSVRHNVEEIRQAFRGVIRERGCPWAEEETRLVASLLEEGQSSGVFTFAEPAEQVAQTMILATIGLMPGHLRPEDFDNPDRVTAKANALAQLLVRAVTATTHRGLN